MHQVSKHFPAFTLVELIVVITIVGILSTVGFVSYSNYLTGARDSNRISQLVKLSDSLQVYGATKSLPLPDTKVDITAGGIIIGYQGYAGVNVLESIDYSNGGKDPKDESYFTYFVSRERKKMQLLAFMEENQSSAFASQGYGADYTNRYPKVYGQKLGVFSQINTNLPLQEISGVSGTFELFTNTGILLTSNFNDGDTLTASGYTSWGMMATKIGEKAPTDCPNGFIGVPGNPEFSTQGFCVAQYEMSYSDGPYFLAGSTWNISGYILGKVPVSQAGKYPIALINQQQAIDACKSMGKGYHLITNNEWMTIGRNLEVNKGNWSGGDIGVGTFSNGVSSTANIGCNVTGGNLESKANATKTGPGNISCNALRSHILSNGSVIWDFSGNIWEHVNKANTIDGTGYNVGQTIINGSSTPTAWDDNGLYLLSDMQKYGSLMYLGRSVGLGNIFYGAGVVNNVSSRGGKADLGLSTGIYSISLSDTSTSAYEHTGFRCTK